MAKHKRPNRKGHASRRSVAPADARHAGLQAFRAGRLDQAIDIWTDLAKDDAPVAAALAEAYFRRALMRPAGAEQVDDLRRALGNAPDDLRYQYHLGLALHRIGDLPAAAESYRAVLRHEAHPDASAMLGLAELERNPSVDLASLPGDTVAVRRALGPLQMLLLREVLPEGNDATGRLWQGLAMLQAGDETARETLNDTRPLPSARATAARHYYSGVAAARADDMTGAFEAWQHLHDQPADSPWLRQNISAALIEALTQEEGDGGDPARALQLALRWRSLATASPALGEALIRTFDRAAHAAASAGDWERAAALWEDARQVLNSAAGLGSPQVVLHNLALAYEAQERWLEAADAWRAMLRTRPRCATSKSETRDGRPGPGEVGEAQWAWLRRRVIESYKRAGAPGEAVAVYRQAIKADPNDLEMRLQLADALLANEQEQSAINELKRVLDIDPRHVEAQLQLAGVYMDTGYPYGAEVVLREVLEQHPDRADVRRAMGRLLLERGRSMHDYGWLEPAVELFEEGQAVAPDNYQFPLNLARIAIERGQSERARDMLERVLTLGAGDSFAYLASIECLAMLGAFDEARDVLHRAENALPLAPGFYIDVGMVLLRAVARQPATSPPSPIVSALASLAEEILDRGMALHGDNVAERAEVISEVLQIRPPLALRYAEEAQRAAPRDARASMMVGLAQALNDREREAKETLRRAAAQARAEGDVELARDIEGFRRQVGTPLLPLILRAVPLLDDLDFDLFD